MPSERYPISHSESLNGTAMVVTKSPFLNFPGIHGTMHFFFFGVCVCGYKGKLSSCSH